MRGDSRPNRTPPSLLDPGPCRSEVDVADHPCSIKSPRAPSWNPRSSPPYLILSPFPSISSIHCKISPEFSKAAIDSDHPELHKGVEEERLIF
jgi:hypothetical protein